MVPPYDGGSATLVNLVNMVNLVKWFRPRKAGSSILVNLDPRLRHSGTSSTGLFGVYLLIRKRAVLRYNRRPPQGKGQAAGGLC